MNSGFSETSSLVTGRLSHRELVARDTYAIGFELTGKLPAEPPKPGQFFQVECGGGREHLLRRPLSVHDCLSWKADGGELLFLVEIAGWGTGRLCSVEPGAHFQMQGPLGRPYELPDRGQALLVAGGMGVAPIYYLARKMDGENGRYRLMAGFSSGDKYYEALGDLEGDIDIYTDDGGVGRRGLVSSGVEEALKVERFEMVLACGPEAMMEKVAGLSEKRGLPCQVSLTSRMACGVGACRGCVKMGRNGVNLCVCSDGPVFDSRMVDWKRK